MQTFHRMMKHEQATSRSLSDDTEQPALQQRRHRRAFGGPVGILAGGIIGGVVGGFIGSATGSYLAYLANNGIHTAIHGG